MFAESVAFAEELPLHGRSQHRQGGAGAHIALREKAPDAHPHAPHLRHRRGHPVDVGGPFLALVPDRRRSHDDRHRLLHTADSLQRLDITQGQGMDRAPDGPGHAGRGDFPGRDTDQVRAELRELRQDIQSRPLAQRREQDHRGDADHNPEHREPGTLPVAQDRPESLT